MNRLEMMVCLVLFAGLFACSDDNEKTNSSATPGMSSSHSATEFKAIGNTDPDYRPPRRHKGEVIVTFDLLPVIMRFNLPSFPCLVTENNISYYNGWTETYDEGAGEGSCEPLMDRENVYSRMWIESQNEARIVVRWRAALVSSAGIIAHKDAPQVSPYGPGDWVDEWYIIYPDGFHVRKSKIYTYFAPVAKPFGWDRDPPNYIFEFQEMLFYGESGHLPEDDIHTEALTLIKMNGQDTTISYDPYPIHFEPDEEELYAAFGSFRNANMFVVNTKSDYHPFTIGRETGVSISPYAPERETRKGIFQSWPQNPEREEGYSGAALGHMILRSFYERTENSISQIYLSGFTNSPQSQMILVPLAGSWLHPPEIRNTGSGDIDISGYDPAQRAYLIELKKDAGVETIDLEIAANETSPLFNPVFLINHWGTNSAQLEIDGKELNPRSDFRSGYYETLDMGKDRTWKEVLVLWLQKKSSKPIRISMRR